jgi:hypothetical protein
MEEKKKDLKMTRIATHVDTRNTFTIQYGALRNYGGRQMRGFVKHLHVYIENLKTEEYCYAKNKIKILKYFLEQVIYLDKSAIRFIIYSFVYKTYLYYDLTSANGNIF